MPSVIWRGRSGKEYAYELYTIGQAFNDVGANYIFTRETSPGSWRAVYIGQTSMLGTRIAQHDKLTCVRREGASHICAHRNDDERNRLVEERDLLNNYATPCNVQR